MHRDTAKRQCVLCLESLYHGISLYHVLDTPHLCVQCLHQYEIVDIHARMNTYTIWVLYRYNDFFKKILYQYKGLYDLALKDAFLDSFLSELKVIYKKHIIVIAPSSQEDNRSRGFIPNEEIAKTFSSQVFTGLYKTVNYKQTDAKNREEVKKVIAIKDEVKLFGKKLVLFDDVVTSGNTLQACISQLEKAHPKSIEILILASNQISTLFQK